MSEEAKEIARKYFTDVSKIEKEFEEKDKEIERLNNRLKTSNDTCNYLRNTIDKAIKYIEEHIYKYYDTQFEEYVEETEFESNTQPNVLLDILKGEKNV